MARYAKSKLTKELEERATEKKPTLLELFSEQPEAFHSPTSPDVDKTAREIIKESIRDVKKIIRKDTRKYGEWMSPVDFPFLIGISEDQGIVHFCLRGIK